MTLRALPALITAALLCGCDTYHFVAGTLYEDGRRPVQAVKHYERFLASRPKDPRACEVRLRAADLYRTVFSRCEEARHHYESAARDFPRQKDCLERAKSGLLLCPNYFPTDAGRTWVYVDSASGGKAMRLEWEVHSSTGRGVAIQSALFAGDKRIQTKADSYERADWAVWHLDAGRREPIIRYPNHEAMAWTVKREKSKVEYLVVSASTTITVAAGTFTGCLKIREKDSAFKTSWRYDYYCPDVGRVMTTIGGPGFENPNTELLRFDKIGK